jgi:hypothetical protein
MAVSTPSNPDRVDECSEGRVSAGPEHYRRDSCDSGRCQFHPKEPMSSFRPQLLAPIRGVPNKIVFRSSSRAPEVVTK